MQWSDRVILMMMARRNTSRSTSCSTRGWTSEGKPVTRYVRCASLTRLPDLLSCLGLNSLVSLIFLPSTLPFSLSSSLATTTQGANVYYKHTKETDVFYPFPTSNMNGGAGGTGGDRNNKIRVTLDAENKVLALLWLLLLFLGWDVVAFHLPTLLPPDKVLACVQKQRIADINLFLPACPLDCRISINMELPGR